VSENKCARCGVEKPEAEGWCALCLAWRRSRVRNENVDVLRARIAQLEESLERVCAERGEVTPPSHKSSGTSRWRAGTPTTGCNSWGRCW
jgi:hypothetical protein